MARARISRGSLALAFPSLQDSSSRPKPTATMSRETRWRAGCSTARGRHTSTTRQRSTRPPPRSAHVSRLARCRSSHWTPSVAPTGRSVAPQSPSGPRPPPKTYRSSPSPGSRTRSSMSWVTMPCSARWSSAGAACGRRGRSPTAHTTASHTRMPRSPWSFSRWSRVKSPACCSRRTRSPASGRRQ